MANSQYEKDKLARKSAAAVLKAKQDNVAPVGISDEDKLKPVTFRQKRDNFWYHNKGFVIAGALLVVFVVGVFLPTLSSVKPDVVMTIISELSFAGAGEVITHDIGKMLVDYNKDGKLKLDVQTVQIVVAGYETNMTPDEIFSSQAMVSNVTTNKENFLYLLSESSYKELVKIGCEFKTLDEFSSDKIKGDKYYLDGTKVSELWDLDGMVDDMFLCIFDFSNYEKPSKKNITTYERQYDFLKAAIEYK